MSLRQYDHQWVIGEMPGIEANRYVVGHTNADICDVVQARAKDVTAQALLQPDRYHRARHATRHNTAQALHIAQQRLQTHLQLPRTLVCNPAGIRQFDSACRPEKQSCAEGVLKIRETPTERGRRNVLLGRRPGYRSLIGR
jgi:hypothetical protein